MLAELERFGRYSLDSFSSGVDVSKFWEIMGPMVRDFNANPDVYISELDAVIANDKGGFATFGAARLMFEVFGSECLSVPAALPLIDAGIEFKAARGQTQMYHMTGYEQQRIFDRRQQGENI